MRRNASSRCHRPHRSCRSAWCRRSIIHSGGLCALSSRRRIRRVRSDPRRVAGIATGATSEPTGPRGRSDPRPPHARQYCNTQQRRRSYLPLRPREARAIGHTRTRKGASGRASCPSTPRARRQGSRQSGRGRSKVYRNKKTTNLDGRKQSSRGWCRWVRQHAARMTARPAVRARNIDD
jgi:hypothetical protein